MDEIFKKIKNTSGFILVTVVLVMSLLLLMVLYVANFTITELKISASQSAATKTYYLAESAIAEAIWRIKNDSTWKDNFENNSSWSYTYTRDPALYSNGSYQIQITNTGPARGEIIATGFLDVGGSTARRVVKTTVYKALGESVVGNNGEYADGNIDISGSLMNIYNGSLFSNNNVILNFWSTINVDDAVRATGNIVKNWTSTINASSLEAANYPPPPAPIPMPAVSFNDPSDPDSYKSRANAIYTSSQFSNLMRDNQILSLPGPITYVTGDVDIKGAQHLTVNGALVVEGDVTVGTNTLLCCWSWRCGRSDLTINQISSTTPAGLLATGRIDFELCMASSTAKGLIYANDKINVLSLPNSFEVTGGLISRKLTITSIWQGIDVIFDNEIINYALGDPQFSPVVTVEHWEEEY